MTISEVPTQTLPAEGKVGFVDIGSLRLENGAVIDDVCIAVQRWGELSPMRDNVVVVLHALTGDSHITGPAGTGHPTPGWWDGVVGSGAPLDTDRWCAVATNVLGGCRGSTGPSSLTRDGKPWGSRFPLITVRDQVEADIAALAALGITEVAAVLGGSMGGARALEWIVGHPDRVRAGLLLAVAARATADQIGTQSTQIETIKADPHWQGGDYHDTGRSPDAGLKIARRFAHLTYRGELELDTRFANNNQDTEDPATGGRYAVQSYLEHQGNKFLSRFDAGSYVSLTEALNSHDVGRGRGGVHAALRSCPVPVVVGGITSDRLYPLRLQKELAELLPGCTELQVVESICGHDGFLVEPKAVGELIRKTLELTEIEGVCPAVIRSKHNRSLSFGSAATAYERGRPSYPPDAIDWLLPATVHRVLDLGAGTGKLTTRLVERGLDVVAVDPIPEMLEVLRTSLPQTRALLGTAEEIPLEDNSVDAVLVAQAWHWVDPALAVPEVARVLRPGGRLGLVWNTRDERLGWVRELGQIIGSDDDQHRLNVTLPAPFTEPQRHQVEWTNYLTPQALIDLVASRSYCITSPTEVRTKTLERVRELLAVHPALANTNGFALPYITVCLRATLTK